MAPSRGLTRLLRKSTPRNACACLSRRAFSSFAEKLSNPSNRIQSYISRSRDPYLNLSIEDYILRKSPSDSTILFLYANRPCVVIGRNQNPWTEVNLNILNVGNQDAENMTLGGITTEPPGIGNVDLVRRRSGGGTVFHDEGNLNWSVVCPMSKFTRDLHAEMVVRALRKMGVERARVNERHDIVLDQGHERRDSEPSDTHRTPFTIDNGAGSRPLKVSGSAYKLTKGRALHHATTLLASPNLQIIPQYLHSPSKPYIEAKGVESVSSPVGNIGLDIATFQRKLQQEFSDTYAPDAEITIDTVGDEYLNIPEIRRGYDELRTKEWLLSQTPQFTLKLDSATKNGIEGLKDARLEMTVHHGTVKDFQYEAPHCATATADVARTRLVGVQLHDIEDWHSLLQNHSAAVSDTDRKTYSAIAACLSRYLPVPKAPGC